MDWITNLYVAEWRLYIKHSDRRYPVPMPTLLNPSNRGAFDLYALRVCKCKPK